MDLLVEDNVNGQHANGQHANGQHSNGQHANGQPAQPDDIAVDNNTTTNATANNNSTNSSNNIQLPEFGPEDMELWLARVESSFRRFRMTDSIVRFDCMMDKLPNDMLSAIKDIVRVVDSLPNPYQQVKQRLGGSRPSALMVSMMSNLPEGKEQ